MKSVFLIISCLLTSICFGQKNTGRFQTDLESLYQHLKETPSFKEQILKKNKKEEYLRNYESLKNSEIKPDGFDSLYCLSKLLWPIKDNHLGLYESFNSNFRALAAFDSVATMKYLESPDFKHYALYPKNIDSLEKELSSKALNQLEGIYSMFGGFKVGIYATSSKDSLVGVMLSKKSKLWQKGEMILMLKQYAPNKFRVIFANAFTKDLIYINNENFTDGTLVKLKASKIGMQTDFSLLNTWTLKKYELSTLDSSCQYLRLSNFGTSNKILEESSIFYNQIKDSITRKNLIVDLRNNPGGGFKNSLKFVKLLKKHARTGKLFVVINRETVSNAEQVTLELRKFKNVTILGETSNGTITYGSNYGTTVDLPGKKYKFYPSDMADSRNDLPYEEIGVTPDVILSRDTEWIKQVRVFIK